MSDPINSPRAAPPRRTSWGRILLIVFLVGSLVVNFLLCGLLGLRHGSSSFDENALNETRLWGEEEAKDRVAVVRIEGVLMDGMTGYFVKQIEQAAQDDKVKAVVVRVDSPGGTVSSSDEIYRLLTQLRQGKLRKYPDAKPKKLFVSMGSVAASGGYYVAMPAERIFAEPISVTGSIGVYASLPNVAKFINQNGVKFELIKAGGIKAAGSPFHEMTAQERQPWQDMVNSSYDHFLGVVAQGRPNLTKAALRDQVVLREKIPVYDAKGNIDRDWIGQPREVDYVRYRADGGSFTAAEALKHGLIDEIGALDAAVAGVATAAGMSKYQVVVYDKPASLLNMLLGAQAKASNQGLDTQRLAQAASPRLWYLAPQADLAGILTGMARD
jgi:protease IV